MPRNIAMSHMPVYRQHIWTGIMNDFDFNWFIHHFPLTIPSRRIFKSLDQFKYLAVSVSYKWFQKL